MGMSTGVHGTAGHAASSWHRQGSAFDAGTVLQGVGRPVHLAVLLLLSPRVRAHCFEEACGLGVCTVRAPIPLSVDCTFRRLHFPSIALSVDLALTFRRLGGMCRTLFFTIFFALVLGTVVDWSAMGVCGDEDKMEPPCTVGGQYLFVFFFARVHGVRYCKACCALPCVAVCRWLRCCGPRFGPRGARSSSFFRQQGPCSTFCGQWLRPCLRCATRGLCASSTPRSCISRPENYRPCTGKGEAWVGDAKPVSGPPPWLLFLASVCVCPGRRLWNELHP